MFTDNAQLMRGNETYRVVPAPKEQRQYPNSVAPARTSQGDSSLEVDERSIFLGSLPYGVTEDEIRDLFAPFGTIVSCSIISKHMLGKSNIALNVGNHADKICRSWDEYICFR